MVIKVAPKLLGEVGHRALGLFTRLQPVVVDAPKAPIRRELADGLQGQYLFK